MSDLMPALAPLPAMPPLMELPGTAAPRPSASEGAQARGAGAQDAIGFVELLALLGAAPGEVKEPINEDGLAAGWAIEAEPPETRESGREAVPADGTVSLAAIPMAVPAPLWWMSAPPSDGSGASEPPAESSPGMPAGGPAQSGFAAEPGQQANGCEGIPILATGAGEPHVHECPAPAEAPPVAAPEYAELVAETDGRRQLSAPVSVALRLEPKGLPEASPAESRATESHSPTRRPAQLPWDGAVKVEGPAASPPPVTEDAACQAGRPAPQAMRPQEGAASESAWQPPRTEDRKAGEEGTRTEAWAEGKPAREPMTAGGPQAAQATASAPQPRPTQESQPLARPGEQPVATRSIEGGAPPEAPREIWLRIEPEKAGERARAAVAVQVTERAGRVEVRVRTPDQALGESLRREMPALVERLERDGFRASVIEAPAPIPSSPSGALRIVQPESAPAFEDEGSRGAGGQAGRQGGERDQDQAPREDGEGAPFASEVTRWLLR